VNRLGKIVVVAGLAAAVYSGYATYRGAQGFNPASIEALKKRMQDDFTAKNVTVVEIVMRRRAPRELVGFVKLKLPGSDEVRQRDCTATMADDLVTTSWSCRPDGAAGQ
jgi:hypothetical protein